MPQRAVGIPASPALPAHLARLRLLWMRRLVRREQTSPSVVGGVTAEERQTARSGDAECRLRRGTRVQIDEVEPVSREALDCDPFQYKSRLGRGRSCTSYSR